MTRIQGGCCCGAVRYEAEIEKAQTMACYCRDCQRATGAPLTAFVAVPKTALEQQGEAKGYSVQGESGRGVTRFFCAECGSQLYSKVEVAPGVLFVKLASLEPAAGEAALAPQVHIWTDSRPSWCPLPEGAVAFGKNPPPR